MKNRALLAVLLLLAACSQNTSTQMDNKQWLASQEGPKVEGVSATLLQAAHDADAAGDWQAASGYYQQLVDKNPDSKEFQVSLADDIRKLGNTDKAIAMYDAVLKKDPDYAPAQEGKGLGLMQRTDFDGAAQILMRLADSNRATWRTYNAIGIIAASRQSPASAKPYFDKALNLSPNNPSILNNMGLSQALNRDFGGAVLTLSQAASLSNARPAFRRQIELNTALVYASAGRLENAEAIAREYYTGPELANNMGFYAHLAQDDQLAKTYLSMALTQSKRFYPRAWENLQAINGNNSNLGTTIMPPNAAPALPSMQPQALAPQSAIQPAMPLPASAQTLPMQPAPQAAQTPSAQPEPTVPETPISANTQVLPTMGYLALPPGAQPQNAMPSQAAQAVQSAQPNPAMPPIPPAQLAPAAGTPMNAPIPPLPAAPQPTSTYQPAAKPSGSMLDY